MDKYLERQSIAEEIVGTVEWNGYQGFCDCPGEAFHTTPTHGEHCKVVCAPITLPDQRILPPGVYCFHSSCEEARKEPTRRLRSELGKAFPETDAPIRQQRPFIAPPEFSPGLLAREAARLGSIDEKWFAARSPKNVSRLSPASVLHELYHPDDKILIFDDVKSQGVKVWEHSEAFDSLDDYREGAREGIWFLIQPISGRWETQNRARPSRRVASCVTRWAYLLLESDHAEPMQWLASMAQLPLPFAAITSSGGRSYHCLVRIDANSKAQWDSTVTNVKPELIRRGADTHALKGAQLARLPNCQRLGKRDAKGIYHAFPQPREQQLIYLNPSPDLTPICKMEPRR